MALFVACGLMCLSRLTAQDVPRCTADSIMAQAEKYIGSLYRRGGMGPKGFDCSGFTRFIYQQFGYTLPHSSGAQGNVGRNVEKTPAQWKKADLMLFNGHRVGKRIGHVGLFLAYDSVHNTVTFIHSAIHGGVRIDRLSDPYYAKRFVGVRRVLPDEDTCPAPPPIAADAFKTRIFLPKFDVITTKQVK